MKKLCNLILIVSVMFVNYAFAGGLESGTSALTELKTWGYTFVGVMALCYILYNVCMAFMERKSWGDVGMAIAYAAIAGGCILAGEYAHNIFN